MQAGRITVERDLMVPARDGVGLATDVYRPGGRAVSGVARAHALRQIGAEPLRAHRCRRAAPLARRGRRLFRRARLCRRLSGLPRPLQIGGPVHEISERSRGRLRHARLADAAELVQRPDRHLRAVLRGAHPGGARLSRPAGSGGAVSRLRRLLERLSQRHPPRRRVRSEAGDLGLQQRAGRRQGPGRQGRAARPQDIKEWFAPDAVAQRATRRSARRRNTRITCSSSGRTARSTISGSSPASMPKAITTAMPTVPVVQSVGLVRPLCAHRGRELSRPVARQARPGAADPRAVDAWRPLAEPMPARSISAPAAPVDGNLAEDFFASAPALVRPLGQAASPTASRRSRRCGSS